jgi:serine/threonine protein kinase
MNARAPDGKSPALRAFAAFAGSSEQRYEIVRKIASGGMATVYLGRGVSALGFERPVAIKACHPHLLEAGDRTQVVLEEARIAALIRHPNVVATLDVTLCDGSVMIVMEYVEGLTVAGLVKAAARADRPVPVSIALRIAEDALAGLHAAHELRGDDGRLLGIVHRDVSPQNVIVGIDGFAKLADFGVFKGDTRSARVTATGEVKGKLGYIAPEVYRGEAATRRSDVYALGVVLWELCAGHRLFDEAADAATMQRVLAGSVPALSSLRSDVPYELDAVLARALALDPTDRFATAEDFSRALEALALTTASTRVVARHVREAMPASDAHANAHEVPVAKGDSGSGSGSARIGSIGSSLAPTAGPDDEERTPHELVTPVRAPRSRSSRLRTVTLAVACLGLAALAGSLATLRTTAPASSHAPASAPAPGPAPAPANDSGLDGPQRRAIVERANDSGPDIPQRRANVHPADHSGPDGRPAASASPPRAPTGAAKKRPSAPSVTPHAAPTVFDPAEL